MLLCVLIKCTTAFLWALSQFADLSDDPRHLHRFHQGAGQHGPCSAVTIHAEIQVIDNNCHYLNLKKEIMNN